MFNLEQFQDLLKKHDWHYNQSDDFENMARLEELKTKLAHLIESSVFVKYKQIIEVEGVIEETEPGIYYVSGDTLEGNGIAEFSVGDIDNIEIKENNNIIWLK